MTIQTLYDNWSIVFLKTDDEQLPRMITGIMLDGDSIEYRLSYGTNASWHLEQEISDEVNQSKKLGIND